MKRTAVFAHDRFLDHRPGRHHVESPERLIAIYEKLAEDEYRQRYLFPGFTPASPEDLALVHTEEYISTVANTALREVVYLDPDTQTSPGSYEAARLAAGAVIRGVEMVVGNEVDNGFALVRPPGHHAEADRAMGFCLFNNVAVGAQFALDRLGLSRVLIVDWDIHHGNGTQHSFYDTDQVLYISTHQYPYYPGSGGVGEVGVGAGTGFTLNIPLGGGQRDREFVSIFQDIIVPVARKYRPELILVSAGFDTCGDDPLGTMGVSSAGFGDMTRILRALAEEVCSGRILMVLEGGYSLTGLRDGVVSVLEALREEKVGPLSVAGSGRIVVPGLDEVRNIAKKFWKI